MIDKNKEPEMMFAVSLYNDGEDIPFAIVALEDFQEAWNDPTVQSFLELSEQYIKALEAAGRTDIIEEW